MDRHFDVQRSLGSFGAAGTGVSKEIRLNSSVRTGKFQLWIAKDSASGEPVDFELVKGERPLRLKPILL